MRILIHFLFTSPPVASAHYSSSFPLPLPRHLRVSAIRFSFSAPVSSPLLPLFSSSPLPISAYPPLLSYPVPLLYSCLLLSPVFFSSSHILLSFFCPVLSSYPLTRNSTTPLLSSPPLSCVLLFFSYTPQLLLCCPQLLSAYAQLQYSSTLLLLYSSPTVLLSYTRLLLLS